jgi:hypothetical protein
MTSVCTPYHAVALTMTDSHSPKVQGPAREVGDGRLAATAGDPDGGVVRLTQDKEVICNGRDKDGEESHALKRFHRRGTSRDEGAQQRAEGGLSAREEGGWRKRLARQDRRSRAAQTARPMSP